MLLEVALEGGWHGEAHGDVVQLGLLLLTHLALVAVVGCSQGGCHPAIITGGLQDIPNTKADADRCGQGRKECVSNVSARMHTFDKHT